MPSDNTPATEASNDTKETQKTGSSEGTDLSAEESQTSSDILEGKVHYHVSSGHLTAASPYFWRMLSSEK